VVYTDTGAWEEVPQPLLSRRYGLVGKPDYLVRLRDGQRSTLVPVEVKSRRRPAVTPDSHILQLATYCLLVEDVHKVRPAYGLLHYADATLQIPFTDALRRAVLESADAIRAARRAPDLHRDHNDPARCRGCGYAHDCGEVVGGDAD
jgi:CRISPR-associated exonuclease Cas4